MIIDRVILTEQAKLLIEILIHENEEEELIFHQAGGCCEGSKPSLYKKRSFRLRKKDVKIGEVNSIPFWVDKDLFEYWQYSQFIIGVVDDVGSGGFSLETPKSKSFITKYKLLTKEEKQSLDTLLVYH